MNLIEIILLAIALGLDCFIVSFCQGLIFEKNKTKNSLLMAGTMGLFQGSMPIITYHITGLIIGYLQNIADWVVFAIFMILGTKFILETFQVKDECKICQISIKCLIAMGIATSIDALGAGIGLKCTGTAIITSTFIIGIASFIMSLAGFWIGNKIRYIPVKYLELAGGLILIWLAISHVI